MYLFKMQTILKSKFLQFKFEFELCKIRQKNRVQKKKKHLLSRDGYNCFADKSMTGSSKA